MTITTLSIVQRIEQLERLTAKLALQLNPDPQPDDSTSAGAHTRPIPSAVTADAPEPAQPTYQYVSIPGAVFMGHNDYVMRDHARQMYIALYTIVDRLTAWKDFADSMTIRVSDQDAKRHRNTAHNYRRLIDIAYDAMPVLIDVMGKHVHPQPETERVTSAVKKP